MNVVVIFSQDDTIQCQPEVPARPLVHDEASLKQVGVRKIFASGNVPGPNFVASACGLPTSQVNAFAISAEDWDQLVRGTVGTVGFQAWTGAPLPNLDWNEEGAIPTAPPGRDVTSVDCSIPILVRELIGRPCRCYRTGDPLTDDFVPERVNIERNSNDKIVKIWFG